MKCCSCGGEIRDDAHFCPLCGAHQEAPVSEPVIAPAAEPAAQPAFIPAEPVAEPAFIPAEPAVVPAEPVAEPVFIPAYEPATVAEPAPAPAPVFEPAPVAEPAPAPQPQYEYVPQPEPIPMAAPVATAQPVYQTAAPVSNAPRYQLPDRRGMWKMLLLGLVTFGIYNMVIMSRIAEEINMVASKHDGQRTQQYFWASMLTGLTLGIYAFVWIHGLCNRMGGELKRRGINYKFSAASFWLWNFLGALIFVGPFIYLHKFCKAMNLINRDYNING